MSKHPTSRNKQQRCRTKRLAICAMLSSLGVVILYVGALLEVLELCVVALAALLIVPIVIEYGRGYPWGVYLATAVLALLLLPQKMPGVIYLLFGCYPIAKAYLERLPRWVCLLLKQVIFVVIEIVMVMASNAILGAQDMPLWYNATLLVLGFITLHLFDIALTKLITLYLRKYRMRFSRLMN
jgi:hypothetical protein